MTNRILAVNPVVSTKWIDMMNTNLKPYVSPGFELDCVNVPYGGMESIEGLYYCATTTPYIVERIIQAEKQGYNAAMSFCFGDPGVKEARENVSIPVIGVGEAALHTAMMCGVRVGILSVGGTYRSRHHNAMMYAVRDMVVGYRLSDRVVSYRTTGKPVEQCQEEEVFENLCEQSKLAIEEDGIDVLVLGCTGMVGLSDRLHKVMEVPVIDPTLAGLKHAEMLISLGLSHSRLAHPSPEDVGAICEMKWPPTLRQPE